MAARKRRPRERRTAPERDPYLAELQDGCDFGPRIRQGRDLEVVDIRDPAPVHVSSARTAAKVRVSRVKDVVTYERVCRRSLDLRHAEAARRFLNDHETGAEGGTPPREGKGQSSGEYDREQRQLDAIRRFLSAKEAMLRANPLHDVAIYIVLKNKSVDEVAAFCHRDSAAVRTLLMSALEVLVDWYQISRCLDVRQVDDLAV